MSHLLFVYGTLKRGGSNHHVLASEKFLAFARTQPGYRMFDVGGHPGLVPDSTATHAIEGELWEVRDAALAALDEFEGVDENYYRREPIALAAPHEHQRADAYIFARETAGLREIGAVWHV
jgi:gamma-glutamylcyclotransferase (GGCT)/AIG2-like uncharacterized protein YtfP